jgi:zinc protease
MTEEQMKSIRWSVLACLCLAIVWTAPVLGQDKLKHLKYPPLNSFELPQPDKILLDNGITLYLLEDHTLPQVNVSVQIHRCGSYLDPPEKAGLASMTGAVMRTGGTARMTGDQVDEALESIGARVETGMWLVSGWAWANGLSENTETIVQTLADILRQPVFDPDRIEQEKTRQRTNISRRNDEPTQIAFREFPRILYGPDSPYSRRAEYATIDAVSRDDMIRFHDAYVQPKYIQIAVWGDFHKEEMAGLLRRCFGDWAGGGGENPAPPEVNYAFHPSINYAEKTDVDQSIVVIGHIGGRMGDPDYPAAIVMNSVLGGSFGSRLFRNVRTRMGLAYATGGEFTFEYDYPGWFYAYVMTKSGTTVKAIRAVLDQIRSMQTIPATDEEMKLGKDGFLNSFVFNFDEKRKIIERMMDYDYYNMPQDYLQQIKGGVEKVTSQDVLDVARRKLHPDDLQVLVVGKAADFDTVLSALGPVHDVDISIPQPQAQAFAGTGEELKGGAELLRKAAAACGGTAAFHHVASISTQAKVTLKMPQGEMALEITTLEVMPDRQVQVIKTPMGEQTMVLDGEGGWVTAMGQSKVMPAEALTDARKGLSRDLIWLFAHAEQPDFQVADKGMADFEGKQALRLDLLLPDENQFSLFLDPATYTPVGIKYMGMSMAGPAETTEAYSDFKSYQGVLLPAHTLQKAGGMETNIEVMQVDVNGQIDQSLFKKPAGL